MIDLKDDVFCRVLWVLYQNEALPFLLRSLTMCIMNGCGTLLNTFPASMFSWSVGYVNRELAYLGTTVSEHSKVIPETHLVLHKCLFDKYIHSFFPHMGPRKVLHIEAETRWAWKPLQSIHQSHKHQMMSWRSRELGLWEVM